MTLATDVFVEGHRSVQLGVQNLVGFIRLFSSTDLPKGSLTLPFLCRRCTVICFAESSGSVLFVMMAVLAISDMPFERVDDSVLPIALPTGARADKVEFTLKNKCENQ